MKIIKITVGIGYLLTAFWVGIFAIASFPRWGSVYLAIVPFLFAGCFLVFGVHLVMKWRSPSPNGAKYFIMVMTGFILASCAILDAHIRHDRRALQTRAKDFLSRPVPAVLETDSIDGYQARENETVLSGSRAIIQRYAHNGRIRYSAAIAGQYATQPFETASCGDADVVKTNKEIRLYLAECQSIIDEEWRMMFWQWVEDTMEMRFTVPEIEEENRVDRFVEQLYYTWTNANATMTISPNGFFSARFTSQFATNIYGGTHVFMVEDGVLAVQSANSDKKLLFRIIHVDKHSLIYELNGDTNTVTR